MLIHLLLYELSALLCLVQLSAVLVIKNDVDFDRLYLAKFYFTNFQIFS